MDRQIFRCERALRVLLEYDATMSARQVVVFLEIARATDGIEAAIIERQLGGNRAAVTQALGHLRSTYGTGTKRGLHKLIEVRDPPGDRRKTVAFLSPEGRKVVAEMQRVMEGMAA